MPLILTCLIKPKHRKIQYTLTNLLLATLSTTLASTYTHMTMFVCSDCQIQFAFSSSAQTKYQSESSEKQFLHQFSIFVSNVMNIFENVQRRQLTQQVESFWPKTNARLTMIAQQFPQKSVPILLLLFISFFPFVTLCKTLDYSASPIQFLVFFHQLFLNHSPLVKLHKIFGYVSIYLSL